MRSHPRQHLHTHARPCPREGLHSNARTVINRHTHTSAQHEMMTLVRRRIPDPRTPPKPRFHCLGARLGSRRSSCCHILNMTMARPRHLLGPVPRVFSLRLPPLLLSLSLQLLHAQKLPCHARFSGPLLQDSHASLLTAPRGNAAHVNDPAHLSQEECKRARKTPQAGAPEHLRVCSLALAEHTDGEVDIFGHFFVQSRASLCLRQGLGSNAPVSS